MSQLNIPQNVAAIVQQPVTEEPKLIISQYSDIVAWVNDQDRDNWISDVAQNRIADEIFSGRRPRLKTDWTEYLSPWPAKIQAVVDATKKAVEALVD